MNQSTTRLSPLVIQHVTELLQPYPELSQGRHTINPQPISGANERRTQIFWRYHGHFPLEFIKALTESLPQNYTFVDYDHLKNELIVEVS
jgi:hypothetical protein